jgi:hypothetical protein
VLSQHSVHCKLLYWKLHHRGRVQVCLAVCMLFWQLGPCFTDSCNTLQALVHSKNQLKQQPWNFTMQTSAHMVHSCLAACKQHVHVQHNLVAHTKPNDDVTGCLLYMLLLP